MNTNKYLAKAEAFKTPKWKMDKQKSINSNIGCMTFGSINMYKWWFFMSKMEIWG